MREELEKKLYNEFPLLYGGRNKPLTESLMGFGCECGDGWYDLLYELSSELEPMIANYYRENKKTLPCRRCMCKLDAHYGSQSYKPGKCLAVHKEATKRFWGAGTFHFYGKRFTKPWVRNLLRNLKGRTLLVINFFLKLFFNRLERCHCEGYDPQIPRASQVKEKFATLRFYMTGYLDEFDELINKAEAKSKITCELCGEPGVLRSSGYWLSTRCEKCAVDRDGKRIPTYEECKKELDESEA